MKNVDASNFKQEVLKVNGTTVVLFHTNNCPYCQTFKVFFEAAESNEFALAEAELSDYDSPLWDQYVPNDTVPTVVVFRNGEEIARKNGVPGTGLTEEDLYDLIRKL